MKHPWYLAAATWGKQSSRQQSSGSHPGRKHSRQIDRQSDGVLQRLVGAQALAWTRVCGLGLGLGLVLCWFVKPSQPHSGPDWTGSPACGQEAHNYTGHLVHGQGCVWNRRLVGVQRILVPGRRKGRGLQCGLVWPNGLNSNGLGRCSCPSLPPNSRPVPKFGARGSSQTKNDGQYVQCSLEDGAAQSSQAALTPRALAGFRSANCQL